MSRLVRTLSCFLVRDSVKSLSLRSLVENCGSSLIEVFDMPCFIGELLTKFIIITVSRSTWMTRKINGVATDLFCAGVISHPGCMFLN